MCLSLEFRAPLKTVIMLEVTHCDFQGEVMKGGVASAWLFRDSHSWNPATLHGDVQTRPPMPERQVEVFHTVTKLRFQLTASTHCQARDESPMISATISLPRLGLELMEQRLDILTEFPS
jgi:hypothetical protein